MNLNTSYVKVQPTEVLATSYFRKFKYILC